jgi:hypothetical protein
MDDTIKFVREMQNMLKRLNKKMKDLDCTLVPMDIIYFKHIHVQSMEIPSSILPKLDNQHAQLLCRWKEIHLAHSKKQTLFSN